MTTALQVLGQTGGRREAQVALATTEAELWLRMRQISLEPVEDRQRLLDAVALEYGIYMQELHRQLNRHKMRTIRQRLAQKRG